MLARIYIFILMLCSSVTVNGEGNTDSLLGCQPEGEAEQRAWLRAQNAIVAKYPLEWKFNSAGADVDQVGCVKLSFDVDWNGIPNNIVVRKSYPQKFSKPSILAISKYKFKPRQEKGLIYVFTLRNPLYDSTNAK